MSDPVPISSLAIELHALEGSCGPLILDVDAVAARLVAGGYTIIEDYIGRRCLSRDEARHLLINQREAQAEAHRRAADEQAEAARRGNPYRTRVQQLARQQQIEPGMSALAVITAGDDGRWDASGERLDEMLSGTDHLRYHQTRQED